MGGGHAVKHVDKQHFDKYIAVCKHIHKIAFMRLHDLYNTANEYHIAWFSLCNILNDRRWILNSVMSELKIQAVSLKIREGPLRCSLLITSIHILCNHKHFWGSHESYDTTENSHLG